MTSRRRVLASLGGPVSNRKHYGWGGSGPKLAAEGPERLVVARADRLVAVRHQAQAARLGARVGDHLAARTEIGTGRLPRGRTGAAGVGGGGELALARAILLQASDQVVGD